MKAYECWNEASSIVVTVSISVVPRLFSKPRPKAQFLFTAAHGKSLLTDELLCELRDLEYAGMG